MQTLIAGGGSIGGKVAIYLTQRGENVTVIDEDRAKCEWLSKNSDATVYNGNTLDPELLMEAGIDKVDALIVALGNDQLTRKVVDFAKSQFGVPKIIAIAQESELRDEIKSSGADRVICSQDEVLSQVENVLQTNGRRTIYQDRQKEWRISRLSVRATSNALGKLVPKLEDKHAKIAGIIRNGNLIFPSKETVFEMGDELFLIGNQEAVEKIADAIEEGS